MIATARLFELATAIRMSTGAHCTPPIAPAVRCNDSQKALVLAHEAQHFSQVAQTLGIDNACFFPAAVSAKEIGKACEKLILPALLAIADTGLFALGATPEEAGSLLDAIIDGHKYTRLPLYRNLEKRLAGRVVVVTGSAQGFGRGIAEELAKAGAYITVADLNDPVGLNFCKELNNLHGEGTAIYAHADVANLESMEALAAQTVKIFGGIDILVSNAGVLKAGSISEMDEAAFDLVTNVNYKAFFLCVKAVTPIFKLQHAINPLHVMDIIQINSKSGLVGSNKNFAYAGSKFGALGLVQSFALELIEQNVKVNAICPGNFYEGPLWSDPEKGLFVQYLRTGKVPGAKTIDEVKEFYMSKVPMKRGCSPLDVARAIFYIHEQEYETGQAIPVTGGQVMLN